MEFQFDTAVRDAQNDAVVRLIGPSPTLRIYGRADKPATCADPTDADVLAEGALPAEWMARSADGKILKAGEWMLRGTQAAGTGAPGRFFRIESGGVCRMQGTFGKDGAMKPRGINQIVQGQAVEIAGFAWMAGNS
jgi:sulfur carrier protein ThiS